MLMFTAIWTCAGRGVSWLQNRSPVMFVTWTVILSNAMLGLRLTWVRAWYYGFFQLGGNRLLGKYRSRRPLDYEFSSVDPYGDDVSFLEGKAGIISSLRR